MNCGVVSIDTVRTYFFLGQINDLEVAAADFDNACLHGFTKENIYKVTRPGLVNGNYGSFFV